MGEMQLTNTGRLLWADALRGVLIILVVVGHALQYDDYENRLSWNMIYSFHMAAFFVISGYVSHRPQNIGKKVIRRARQLLIPFVVWTLLVGVCGGNVVEHTFSAIQFPDKSFWFLWVLFFITVLFDGLCAWSKNISLKYKYLLLGGGGYFILALCMVLFEWRMFGFQFIAYYFGFYALGYALRYHDITIKPSFALCCGCLWLVLSLYWRMHAVPEPLEWITIVPSQLINYSYRFITAFCACIFLIGIVPVIFRNSEEKLPKILAYLGTISLGIYVLHIFMSRWIDPYLTTIFGPKGLISFICVEVLVKLGVSILGVELIRRIPIISRVLLGK